MDELMYTHLDEDLLLKDTFEESFDETSNWVCPSRNEWLQVWSRAGVVDSNNPNSYLSSCLNDFKRELFRWWWCEHEAIVNSHMLRNSEYENSVMEIGRQAERNSSNVCSYNIVKSSFVRKLNFQTKVDRPQSIKQSNVQKQMKSSFKRTKYKNVQRKQIKRLPFCRHYNEGYCKRGTNCEFRHILSVVYPDSQKVFLGGLPLNITERELSEKLEEQGFHVINEPSIMHKYSPQVCLKSVGEAQRLINKGTVMINGVTVDVRRYEAITKKQQERLADISRRSIFLGGLQKETTPKIIRGDLAMIGMKVVNHLTVKSGFCPQVTLATPEQARELVCKAKVLIKGKWVNVRPFIPKLLGR